MAGFQDFLTHVRDKNLARSNRYEVEIMSPNGASSDMRIVSMLAEDVMFPGLLIGTKPLRINNATHQRASFIDHMGDSLTITFFCDTDWSAKNVFSDWMELIVNPYTREVNYPSDYYGELNIYSLNEKDERIEGWNIMETFPRAIAPIQASATNAQPLRLPVSFAYFKWQKIDI